MTTLKGKNIILALTGSIAAYKGATLARLLVKAGANVQVIMTPNATEFITPLTLSTLTDRPVIVDFFEEHSGSWNSHVDLGLWADLMVVAPATATTLGKMANGIADNMVVTTYLSCRAPILVAPAMDMDMYGHPSTAKNILQLQEWDVDFVEPGVGELASHLCGKGRMAEPEEIFDQIARKLLPPDSQSLDGMHFLITSGPTREPIDPVRYIGNHSSGKMGKALAEAAMKRGATVHFITGPVSYLPKGEQLQITKVETADQMAEACQKVNGAYDVAIFCAAVADYKVEEPATYKIKREEQGPLTLHLCPNPDIAAMLGEEKQDGQIHVGFALESHVSPVAVMDKLQRKHLDLIVVNSHQDIGAGFGTDTNKVSIYDILGGTPKELPLMSKEEVAEAILDSLEELL